MKVNQGPYLAPPEALEGAPGAGDARTMPSTLPADQVPSTSVREASTVKVTSQGPPPAKAEGVSERPGSAEPESAPGVALNYFSKDFDSSKLSEEVRPVYDSMRTELDKVLEQIPSMDVLNELALRAQAFERLSAHPAFDRFIRAIGTEDEEPASGGKRDTPEVSREVQEDEDLSALDDRQQSAVQRIIDKALEERVEPMMKDVTLAKAKNEIAALETKYGKPFSNAMESGRLSSIMKAKNCDAEDAYRWLMGDQAVRSSIGAKGREIQEKLDAQTEESAGLPRHVRPIPQKVRTVADAMRKAEEELGSSL